MDTRLPKQDSATGRSLKTTAFASASALVVFGSGLLTVLQGVPGCSEAVLDFLQANALQLSVLFGVPAGIFSFLWNFFGRKSVQTY